jgi:catechol 2,3-dioxygenase-like lactoylglutathione lyase family enzyme
MTLRVAQDAIDLGIVTTNEAKMRDFYERVLGLAIAADVPISNMGRIVKLQCGGSVIKLFVLEEPPESGTPASHYLGATGLRYFTVHIANLRDSIAACRVEGVPIVNDIVEPRPGVLAALIADPDGNTIELMETA